MVTGGLRGKKKGNVYASDVEHFPIRKCSTVAKRDHIQQISIY